MKFLGKNGFTMLETLFVCLLIAFLVSTSFVEVPTGHELTLLEQTSAALLNFLREAQKIAHRTNSAVQISSIATGDVGWTLLATTKPSLSSPRNKVVSQFSPVVPHQFLFEVGSVHFSFHGTRNTAIAGRCTLLSRNGAIELVVSSKGRIRRCAKKGAFAGVATC